jgi:putative transposase
MKYCPYQIVRKRRSRQGELPLQERFGWGGRRDGAGRRSTPRSRVRHRARAEHDEGHPVHVTLRAVREVGHLRAKKPFQEIRDAIRAGSRRGEFRVVCFSVQHNHLHLIVEAPDARTLSRGMQGLAIRIARALNRLLHRSGPVFGDRYHRHDLSTPRETRAAIAYVLQNWRKHASERGQACERGPDPCSSGPWFDGWSKPIPAPREPPPIADAETWLFATGWRIHAPIGFDETPAMKRVKMSG